MGLISLASGRDTETMEAFGNSSKIRLASAPLCRNDGADDISSAVAAGGDGGGEDFI